VRDLLLDLSRQGRTIVLSSHQMDTVERLCHEIALIHRGEKLLDGRVSDVKRRRGRNTVVIAYEGGDASFLAGLPEVREASDFGRHVELRLHDGADAQAVLHAAAARLRVTRFELVEPSLHEIFVEQVTAHGGELPPEMHSGAGGPA
jgi:ABC-2 type transport system ATP-binding protein